MPPQPLFADDHVDAPCPAEDRGPAAALGDAVARAWGEPWAQAIPTVGPPRPSPSPAEIISGAMQRLSAVGDWLEEGGAAAPPHRYAPTRSPTIEIEARLARLEARLEALACAIEGAPAASAPVHEDHPAPSWDALAFDEDAEADGASPTPLRPPADPDADAALERFLDGLSRA